MCLRKNFGLVFLVFCFFLCVGHAGAQKPEIFKKRRAALSSKIDEGIVIIQSTEKNQDHLYEFFIPNSNNHDFMYLTGLDTPGATLVLCPKSNELNEILYIGEDPETVKKYQWD